MQHKSCFIVVLVFGFIPLAGAFADGDPAAQRSPSAHFPETHYEFPPVPEGTEVTHVFTVQNRGDAPLMIDRVRTD